MKRKNKKNKYMSRYQVGGPVVIGGNTQQAMRMPIAMQQAKMDSTQFVNTTDYHNLINQGKTPSVSSMYNATANLSPKRFSNLMSLMNKNPKNVKQSGGMYGDNQIPAGMGSTAMTVYQESNPQIQAEREKDVEQAASNIRQEGMQLSQELMRDEQQAKMDIAEAGQTGGKFDSAVSMGVEGIKGLDKLGAFDSAKKKLAQKAAEKVAKEAAAKQAAKLAASDITTEAGKKLLGEATLKTSLQQAAPGAMPKIGVTGIQSASQEALKSGTTELAKAGAQEAAKTGLIQSSVNPNAVAMAANIGGKALSMAADDQDETTWNAGEVTGDVLGKAGEYAGYGAMLGSVVPGIGNVAGALGGAVVGGTVAAVQGLTGRKKARKAEAKAEKEKQEKIQKFNVQAQKDLATRRAVAQAGALRQKTYSGYDLGRNVSYKFGGYNAMPRYAA
jgi:hypothetical protein